jgi:hypothetical protein
MSTIYTVSTLPVRDSSGAIRGWVRCDPLADGSKPTDMVILRDGSAWGQEEALSVVNRDPSLLYATREEAARDGLARLRQADEGGQEGYGTSTRKEGDAVFDETAEAGRDGLLRT